MMRPSAGAVTALMVLSLSMPRSSMAMSRAAVGALDAAAAVCVQEPQQPGRKEAHPRSRALAWLLQSLHGANGDRGRLPLFYFWSPLLSSLQGEDPCGGGVGQDPRDTQGCAVVAWQGGDDQQIALSVPLARPAAREAALLRARMMEKLQNGESVRLPTSTGTVEVPPSAENSLEVRLCAVAPGHGAVVW